MSRTQVIAKLVEAGHEDLAEQLIEGAGSPLGLVDLQKYAKPEPNKVRGALLAAQDNAAMKTRDYLRKEKPSAEKIDQLKVAVRTSAEKSAKVLARDLGGDVWGGLVHSNSAALLADIFYSMGVYSALTKYGPVMLKREGA